ncbi:hypothetical protein [Paenibacillus sp. YN15]|uniref:hypothetical protein n=1 Tax=Paenibacillus sp. YN15 TaxID=1742774 RepID=UPI000DCBB5A5|nr:hypothetical protein [Paenibacillus sp. YN15]RAU99231.1 hypothetical protein DQG13_16410 [Paenibacillus sp. YN15]
MRYFERTNRMAHILFAAAGLCFIISLGIFFKGAVSDQIFEFSNGNFVKNGILFAMFFLSAVFSLVLGIVLKCIVRDAKEELDNIGHAAQSGSNKLQG